MVNYEDKMKKGTISPNEFYGLYIPEFEGDSDEGTPGWEITESELRNIEIAWDGSLSFPKSLRERLSL